MSNDYREIFGADGPLARALPQYAYRPEQATMATAVDAALAHLEPLIVEAGTGTGKTFAYLVPALLSGRSVIISTGTRTLQDQLYRRDVPMLARALGMPVRFALLKGRANYLCRHRLEMATAQRDLLGGRNGNARLLGRIAHWAGTTQSGDLAELTDIPDGAPVWPLVTSTRENCLGQECPQFARCHVFEARRQAQAADVVVVNHHLLLADLALKDEGFGDLLPGTEAVILDEAHQIPDIAAQFFGQSWSARQAQLLLRDTQVQLQAAAVASPPLQRQLAELQARLEDIGAALPGGSSRRDFAQLSDRCVELLSDLAPEFTELARQLEALGAGAACANCGRRAAALAATLTELLGVESDAGVRWVEASNGGWTLQFTPFEIAARLREFIEGRPCAWVFTSATLAIGDDFTHFAARIGLPDARTLRIDSPFDYRRQALIYLPQGMPPPSAPDYAAQFIARCAPLLEASGGRDFLLYTSYRALAEGLEALQRRFPDPPFPVLVQGEAPREVLLTRFRELGNAVLLATASFWEGVDVKGEALSIVAIDKLPFAAPDDPLLAARLEGIRRRGGNPFMDYQLPQAVLALKQGAGRLIRDADDFGVILIADPRVRTKAYGRAFLEALPPCPVTSDSDSAARFLAERLQPARVD